MRTRLFLLGGRLLIAGLPILLCGLAVAETRVYSGTIGTASAGYMSYEETQPNTPVYAGIAKAQQKVMSSLKSAVSQAILPKIAGVTGYQQGTGYASATGPLNLSLKNGVASFSGLKVEVGLTVKQVYAGVAFTCKISASTDPGMTISGSIDPVSGKFLFTGLQNFGLSPAHFCGNSLDWMPFIGDLLDILTDMAVDKVIAKQTQNAFNALDSINELVPIKFSGLDKIPNGMLVYRGTDFGAQLKASLPDLFRSTNLSVIIGDPKYLITGPSGYAHIATSSDLVFSIKINGLFFQLLDNRTYVDEVFCPPPSPVPTYCYFF